MLTDAIESLHAVLDADPSDADARLRLAELFDILVGHPTLFGGAQRWMAVKRRWPGLDGVTWDWWGFRLGQPIRELVEMRRSHTLPLEVFSVLFGGTESPSGWALDCCYREYPTRRAAEDALAVALAVAHVGDPPP